MMKPNEEMRLHISRVVTETPSYFYSLKIIFERTRALVKNLGTPVVIELSSCPLQEILSRLPKDIRLPVSAVSKDELIIMIGSKNDANYFRSPHVPRSTMRSILGAGVSLIAESPRQIDSLISLRGRRNVRSVGVSLALSSVLQDRQNLIDCKEVHLGMSYAQVVESISKLANAEIELGGLAVNFKKKFKKNYSEKILIEIIKTLERLEIQTGYKFKRLHLGEWFGAENAEQSGKAYRTHIKKISQRLNVYHTGGQSIFEQAGILATKVVDILNADGTRCAICDASIANAFIATRAASGLRNNTEFLVYPQREVGETIVVGASGIDGDVFATVPYNIQPEDLLLKENMGGFARTYSPHALCGLGPAKSFILVE